MKRLTFLQKMDIPESEFKKDEKLEEQITKFQTEFKERIKKKIEELDEPIWQAYESFRKAQILNSDNLADLHGAYTSLAYKKEAIKNAYQREVEAKRREREILSQAYKLEVLTLLEIESSKLMNRYVLQLPDLAVTPSGRELDHRGYRHDPLSDTLFMKIQTNASSIVKAQEVLVLFRGRIVNAQSLKDLKEILEALQKQFDEIDFDPKEIEVEENFFERLDKTKPTEVAIRLPDGKIQKIKGENQ